MVTCMAKCCSRWWWIATRRDTSGRIMRRGRALCLAAMLWATSAAAVDTQLWVSDAPDDYTKAEARGVVVSPEGVLGLGPRTASSTDDSMAVVWAVAPLPDGSVAIAGDHGRVDRWTESGGVRPWVKLPVGQVLSLSAAGGELIAGTGPGGIVYRIGAKGDTSLLVRTGERYVWGLAPAGKAEWWAATGTKGRILKLSRGKSTLALDTEESNLVCMVGDGRGGCYAGGDSKGTIVHVSADGRASTTY